jgi:hypothetical protein
MELPSAKEDISYKMPATTRSSTRSFHAAANAINAAGNTPLYITVYPGEVAPPNNNKKWSTEDQRTLLRMCRQMDVMPETMAAVLGRSEDAIRYRLAKIVHEHLDGRTDQESIREVSDWILPNY